MSISENDTTLSTLIPELGMTFGEASQKIANLIEQDNAGNPEDMTLTVQWTDLRDAVLEAEPRTIADAVVMFDLMLGTDIEMGLPTAAEQALLSLQTLLKGFAGSEERLLQVQVQGGPSSGFAAAVAAFEAEGVKANTVPVNPSEAMVAAAVEATGCHREMVLKGFAAMVEARRREVA